MSSMKHRGPRLQMFLKIGALKNVATFQENACVGASFK